MNKKSIEEIAHMLNTLDRLQVQLRFRPGFNKFFASFSHEVALKTGDKIDSFLFHKWQETTAEAMFQGILDSFMKADSIIISSKKATNEQEYMYDKEQDCFLLIRHQELNQFFKEQKKKLKKLNDIIELTNSRFHTEIQTEEELIQFFEEKIKTKDYHSDNNLTKNTLSRYQQLKTN